MSILSSDWSIFQVNMSLGLTYNCVWVYTFNIAAVFINMFVTFLTPCPWFVLGGYPGEGGKLADTPLNVSVLIPFNDDPFGVFAIAADNLDQEVAEDVLSEDDMSDVTSFTILRQQGAFGDVRVSWEIMSANFKQGLPLMDDLLLQASFPDEVELRPHARRHHSATETWFFSGLPGAYGTISPEDAPEPISNFTFSAWLAPKLNTDGFIVSKGKTDGSFYYGIKVHTNESHVTVMLYYTVIGSNNTQVARATAEKFVDENKWLHVLITVDDGIIEFFLDGISIPGGLRSIKGEGINDGRFIFKPFPNILSFSLNSYVYKRIVQIDAYIFVSMPNAMLRPKSNR